MARILIGGYYGGGNLGDEAILAATLGYLSDLAPGLKFTVASWDPDRTSQEHEVEACYWRDIPGLVTAAQQADLILVGGGGLFQDHWGLDPGTTLRVDHGGITTYGSLPLLAEMTGRPCTLYGVGIGPLQGEAARKATRQAAERCQRVTVRDRSSARLLRDIGYTPSDPRGEIQITADPAFGLRLSPSAAQEVDRLLERLGISPGEPLLGVNLRYWDQPHAVEDWLQAVHRGLEIFQEKLPRLKTLLIPFQVSSEAIYTDDRALCQRLISEYTALPGVQLVRDQLDPSDCQELLSRCDLVLGTRLHSLILAFNQGVPAVALPYDPKVSSLMTEADLEDQCLPGLVRDGEVLGQALWKAWETRGELGKKAADFAAEQKRRARLNAQLALDLLGDENLPTGPNLWGRIALGWVKTRAGIERLLR